MLLAFCVHVVSLRKPLKHGMLEDVFFRARQKFLGSISEHIENRDRRTAVSQLDALKDAVS